MEYLPPAEELDIASLSRCFKNVSNSYKFYWFLAILDHLAEGGDRAVSLDDLSIRMLSSAWYPLDYYKLSFGKQDGFKDLAVVVSRYLNVDNGLKAPSLKKQIEVGLPEDVGLKLKFRIKNGLKRWVSYRFLSPFFTEYVRGYRDQEVNDIIKKLASDQTYKDIAPYEIVENGIVISDKWLHYLQMHQTILRGFIKWHLLRFLQKHNANVVGLSEKLEKPQQRDLKRANHFWSEYLKQNQFTCIYAGQPVGASNFSLDHFIPWSYIAHDQLWNIVPTSSIVNSTKNDTLPNLSTYLQRFCAVQFEAVTFHLSMGNHRLLEDYYLLLGQSDLLSLTLNTFAERLSVELSNHCRIATNLGFRRGFQYS